MINWSLMGTMLLVLLVFFATGAALLFYVRHWAGRHAQQASGGHSPTEGRYFKRYIPPALRASYDAIDNIDQQHAKRHVRWLNAFFSTGVIALLITITAVAVISNRDRILAKIDLSDAEVAQLDTRRHRWIRDVDYRLPKLSDYLPAMARHGATLITNPSAGKWLYQDGRPGKLAKAQWENFLNAHDIPFRSCRWSRLLSCHVTGNNSLYIVTPGRWNLALIDQLLAKGANVLVYGAPTQVLRDGERIDWQGLQFEPYGERSHNALAVRGDQLLSLGMDAGLVVELAPLHSGYRVLSAQPQAVALGEDGRVGGELETRLYARSVGPGRLVWFDFAPHADDHGPSINTRHLDALVAAAFRYLLREEYGAWASWPAARRFAGLIEEDTEDGYHYAARVVEMVREEQFPITWFALSNIAQQERDLTVEMARVGEIACHGDNHADFNRDELKIQVERLARCRKVLATLTGQAVRGFRPPREEFNAETVDAIFNNQLSYYFAGGDADRAVPSLSHSETGQLVSLPRVINDDYEIWTERQLNHDDTLALVEHEMDWVEALGGLYPFSFHSQYMDDDEHLDAVRQIGRQLRHRNAWFATAGEIADWWRLRHQLLLNKAVTAQAWARFEPAYLRVDSSGQLRVERPEPPAEAAPTDKETTP